MLSKLKLWKRIYFSWDNVKDESRIEKGIQILKNAGICNESKISFYVLIGFDSTEEEDLHRVKKLKSFGINPFVMPFDKFNYYQYNFARYVNRKEIFNSIEWHEYSRFKK